MILLLSPVLDSKAPVFVIRVLGQSLTPVGSFGSNTPFAGRFSYRCNRAQWESFPNLLRKPTCFVNSQNGGQTHNKRFIFIEIKRAFDNFFESGRFDENEGDFFEKAEDLT